jgi:O-antigen/teichoic acid export membrane protein
LSKLRLNVFANFLGQGWAALLQLVFIPVYIKLIGIEAYGLVGFYVALLTTVQVFDLGLGQTMTREFARLAASPGKLRDARDLLKTVGLVYWGVASLIAAAVLLVAPFLASHVIKAQTLSQETTRQAIMLMAVIIPMQWSVNLRLGALMGLERQVLVNVLRIVMATLAAGGTVLVLWLVSATVTAFFWWQLLVSVANFAIVAVMLNRVLPFASRKPRFDLAILRQIRRFAVGMSGINIASIILTQLDKWILITLLPLKVFGYYALAGTVANALYIFITPIFNGLFPRFSILFAQGKEEELKKLYHLGAQAMAAVIIPVAILLSLFSHEVLLLWTHDPEIADATSVLVSMLVWGTALNGLMNIPYALQLSHGWTSLAFRIVLIKLVILVPIIYILVANFGAPGAALAWLLLNIFYILMGIPLTHRRLLKGEAVTWAIRDVFQPALVASLVGGIAYVIWPAGAGAILFLGFLVCAYSVAVLAAGMVGGETRLLIADQARKWGLVS